MPSPFRPLPLLFLLLPACSSTVHHGNPKYLTIETEARIRILATLKTMNGDQRDTVKYAAPVTNAKKLPTGEIAVFLEWRTSRNDQITARYIGDPESPNYGKFDVYMITPK